MRTRELIVGGTGRARLLAGGAAVAVALAAQAADAKPMRKVAIGPERDQLRSEVAALRAQVAALTARLDVQQSAPPPAVSPVQNAALDSEAQSTAQSTATQIEELQAQVADMQQQQAVAVGQRPAVVTLPNGRPTFSTADGNFTANFHGVMQFDAGLYLQERNLPSPPFDQRSRDLNSGTNVRRARIGLDGKLFGDFDYSFLYDFGGSGSEDAGRIHEIWVQYSGLRPWRARIGAFEPLIGMDANMSTNSIPLLERASPAETSRNVAAGDFRTALQVSGNDDFNFGFGAQTPGQPPKTHWLLSAALTGNTVGTVNSTGGFATQPFDEQRAVIGRLALAPFGPDWTLHLGVHGQYVMNLNDGTGSQLGTTGTTAALAGRYTATLQDRPELRLDTTRLVTTGALNANHVAEAGVEGGFQWKRFYGQAEYFRYLIDGNAAATSSPDFTGYYVTGSVFLSDDIRGYNPANGAFSNVTPNNNFDLGAGTWGAFELAARYSVLDLNFREGVAGAATPVGGVRGGEQRVFSAALNWYLNPTIRFMLQGQNVDIERLSPAGLRLDQTYQTLALRSQIAF